MIDRTKALLLLFAATLMLAGCVTGPQYHVAVCAPNAGALVAGSTNSGILFPMKVTLQMVDGARLSFWQKSFTDSLLIDPGTRLLTVRCEYSGFPWSGKGCAELKATLQAGHAYTIRCERQKRILTFWAEDTATLEAASARQTTTASASIHLGGGLGGLGGIK